MEQIFFKFIYKKMKGIKAIFGALAVAGLLSFSFSANAQENGNRDENGKIVRGAYETNEFCDNWFVGVGAGINGAMPDLVKFDGYGLAVDAFVGKWLTPSVGARVGWKGLKNKTDEMGKFTQQYIHADALWNISNAFSGYKETRFWDVIPYASFGGLIADKNYEWVGGAGILNDFRLGGRVDLFVDLNVLLTKEAQYKRDGRFYMPFSATAGLIFNLGKTGFSRHTSVTPVVVPVPFTTEQYNALKAKVAALEAENAALKDKIAQLEARKPEVIVKEGKSIITPATLYFDFDKATLSEREKAHLEYFITNLPEDAAVEINGYADKTGNATYNQKLAERRAAAVKAIVEKAGVKVAACEGKGVTEAFGKAFKNRVATVKVAE